MGRKSSKTPAELAAELETRARNIRLRAAKEEASTNPHVAALQSVLESTNKEIAEYSRKLVGPNSFENRIRSQELRKVWIEAEKAEVLASDTNARSVKDYLQHSIAELAIMVSENKEVPSGYVANILANVPQDANLAALAIQTIEAEKGWRDFTKAKAGTLATGMQNTASEGA